MEDGFYGYSINNVSVNKNNSEVLDISYGRKTVPLTIYKKDAADFVKAIITDEEINLYQVTKERIDEKLEKEGTDVLNYFLNGRIMILQTGHKSYLEYVNGGQNAIKLITGLNLDGTMRLKEAFDYGSREPSFEEIKNKSY